MKKTLLRLRKIAAGMRSPLGRRALKLGTGASVEHLPILRCLAPSLVVDVGANRGQFALAAITASRDAHVVSFEPLQRPTELARALFSDCERITWHQSAVGPHRGTIDMHVSAADDSSSVLPISDLQSRLYPGTEEVARETASIAPLTDFLAPDAIPEGALLKIDVQGYEKGVLQGSEPLLHRFRNIYCECSFQELYEGQPLASEIISWLFERGFGLRGVFNADQRGQETIQADFLFERAP